MKLLLVCSSGGHLAQLMALEPWWSQHDRMWVVGPTEDARRKLADEDVVECAWPTQRSIPNLARNTVLARRVLDAWRPDVVLSTGAAVAVPFLLRSHRVGARSIYLETVDRIEKPSLTGRIVYPFVDEYLTQWEQLAERLPRARNVGVVL